MYNKKELRNILRANFSDLNGRKTDQQLKLPQPPLEKEVTEEVIIDLEKPFVPKKNNLKDCIRKRRSRRVFKDNPLTLQELTWLLWASQGVKSVIRREEMDYATLRTVPSGGARHPFETYIIVLNTEGLEKGIYRYIALEHKLAFLGCPDNLNEKINKATFGQNFCGRSGAVFVWSVVPYRTEWRYSETSYKTILLDAGHVCQNLYLAAESVRAGACAIAAYDQEKLDTLLGLDGTDEFAIYLSPVGKT
jgi:SagB-type dehydrogenase family enzyme